AVGCCAEPCVSSRPSSSAAPAGVASRSCAAPHGTTATIVAKPPTQGLIDTLSPLVNVRTSGAGIVVTVTSRRLQGASDDRQVGRWAGKGQAQAFRREVALGQRGDTVGCDRLQLLQ